MAPSPDPKETNTSGSVNLPEHELEHAEGLPRFLAYAQRIGKLLSGVSRYSAYASDVGEAFRPVVPVSVVNATYGVAFGYVGCDIVYNGYLAQQEKRSVPRAVAHATVFQSLASLGAPYLIIHSTVSMATKACKQMGRFQRWGPTTAGLALIPLLPSLVDEPIEEAVEWAFDTYWPEEAAYKRHLHHNMPIFQAKKDH